MNQVDLVITHNKAIDPEAMAVIAFEIGQIIDDSSANNATLSRALSCVVAGFLASAPTTESKAANPRQLMLRLSTFVADLHVNLAVALTSAAPGTFAGGDDLVAAVQAEEAVTEALMSCGCGFVAPASVCRHHMMVCERQPIPEPNPSSPWAA